MTEPWTAGDSAEQCAVAKEASSEAVHFSAGDRVSLRLPAYDGLPALRDAGQRAGSSRAALPGWRRRVRWACYEQRDGGTRVAGIGMRCGHEQREASDEYLQGAYRELRPQRHAGKVRRARPTSKGQSRFPLQAC
ncbi:MAG: hypothetical protein JW940_04265 [Polyangiaceae bacterium]|nr:hypothetical protein [Polyangiaceae bacterium]